MRKTAVILFAFSLMLAVGCSKDPAQRCKELGTQLSEVEAKHKESMKTYFKTKDKDAFKERTKALASEQEEIEAEMGELNCSQYE